VVFRQSTLSSGLFQLQFDLLYSPFEMKSYLFVASLGTECKGFLCGHFPGICVDGDFSVGFRCGAKMFGFFHTEFTKIGFFLRETQEYWLQ